MVKVFISHSSSDQEFVEQELLNVLSRHGIDTWYMQTGIRSASDWEDTILEALELCDWFLVVLSTHSVVSEWVKDEVHWAISRRPGRIVTVLVEECDIYRLHIRLPRIQYIDYRADRNAARGHLLDIWNIDHRQLPHTEMQVLANKHSICSYRNGRLTPCEYHRDRMEVRLYEKRGYSGELNLSDTHVRLLPDPEVLDLLATMQMKTQVAGHWGLMREHRDWIGAKLRGSLARRRDGDPSPITVAQCGVAGLVHYFANLAILVEQLDDIGVPKGQGPAVILKTRDICAGSIRPIEVLLDQLRELRDLSIGVQRSGSYNGPFRLVNVDGYAIALDESFWALASSFDLVDDRVVHDLKVQDLTSQTWSDDISDPYDIVISHHLFSMWSDGIARAKSVCENLSKYTVAGSEVFIAMNVNRIDPGRPSIMDYHRIFNDCGFVVQDARLVWDVYDLDHDVITGLLVERQEIDVVKDCALVHYKRQ